MYHIRMIISRTYTKNKDPKVYVRKLYKDIRYLEIPQFCQDRSMSPLDEYHSAIQAGPD